MRQVLFWIFVFFSSGIVIGTYLNLQIAFLYTLSLISLILAQIFVRRFFSIFILSFFFFLGGFWINQAEYNQQRLFQEFLNRKVVCTGKVVSSVFLRDLFSTYTLELKAIKKEEGKEVLAVKKIVRVKDYSRSEVSYLDTYVFKGKLVSPGGPDTGSLILYVKKEFPPFLIKKSRDFRKIFSIISLKIEEKIKRYLFSSYASFISAVLLGKRYFLPSKLKNIFIRGGTAHILAVSGLHIMFVGGIVLFFLRSFGLKYHPALILASVFVIFYAFLCGLKPPVLRASLMFLSFSLSSFLRRKPSPFVALALAGFVDLLMRPEDIFRVSFQLSFLGVFFILLGVNYFRFKKKAPWIIEYLRMLFVVSLFVNIGIWPLVSYYFGKIYLLNILANLIVVPFLGLILVASFIFLGFSFQEFTAKILANSLSFLIFLFIKINAFFANLSFSSLQIRISLTTVFFYYLAIFSLLIIKELKKPALRVTG